MKYFEVTIKGSHYNALTFTFTSFTEACLFAETAINHAPECTIEIKAVYPVEYEKACE